MSQALGVAKPDRGHISLSGSSLNRRCGKRSELPIHSRLPTQLGFPGMVPACTHTGRRESDNPTDEYHHSRVCIWCTAIADRPNTNAYTNIYIYSSTGSSTDTHSGDHSKSRVGSLRWGYDGRREQLRDTRQSSRKTCLDLLSGGEILSPSHTAPRCVTKARPWCCSGNKAAI